MARRVAGTLIAAATLLFVVVSFFGTANIGTLVPESSGSRGQWPVFTVTGVTDAGREAGLRVGDVLDYRRLTPLERYRFDLWDSGVIPQAALGTTAFGSVAANESFTIPYLRNGKVVPIVQRTDSAGLSDQVAAIVTDILSAFCAIFGALLLVRGRDRASFLGGIFLALLSMGGLPFVYGFNGFYAIEALAVPSEVWIMLGQVGVVLALYLFAESLLPSQTRPAVRWICRALYAPLIIVDLVSNYIAVRFLTLGDVDSIA